MTDHSGLNEEDQDMLDALTGRRSGSRAERALRRELLNYAEVMDQAPDSEIRLSRADVDQRERARGVLMSAGVLPPLGGDTAAHRAPSEGLRSRWGHLFGGAMARWQWSAGVAAACAVIIVGALVALPREGAKAPDELARNPPGSTVLVRDSDTYCGNLTATLQASLPDARIVTTPGKDGCALQVATGDPQAQAVAQKIFAEAGVRVLTSPRMEIEVRESK